MLNNTCKAFHMKANKASQPEAIHTKNRRNGLQTELLARLHQVCPANSVADPDSDPQLLPGSGSSKK